MILLITKRIQDVPPGGRELLSKTNRNALRELFDTDLIIHELSAEKPRSLMTRISALRGLIDGLSPTIIESIVQTIREVGVRQVFIDGSNLGELAKALKRLVPSVEITTFFHNVEARFFWGALRARPTLHAMGVLLSNVIAERNAISYSDEIICLSQRDSCLLKKLYGRAASHIAPMVIEEKRSIEQAVPSILIPERFALFVGGNFYANRHGITWFVREVAPSINVPLLIIGRGFGNLSTELDVPGKVIVIGSVDSLDFWYQRARFVIAPIFDGSGMKTKVAEALMYGKKIVGTPEAFSGYDEIVNEAGWICRNKSDFIDVINELCVLELPAFDPRLRELYEQNYSFDAAKSRLAKIIGCEPYGLTTGGMLP